MENVKQTLSVVVKKLPIPKTECLKVACSLFDELSSQFLGEQIIGSEELGKWEPSTVSFKYTAEKMMFGGTALLMFDMGITSWRLKGSDSINSSEIPGNSVVGLWLGKVMFCFDPGGCFFLHLDFDPFSFIEQGNFYFEICVVERVTDTDMNLTPFTGNNAMFLFDPGGNYFAFGNWNLQNTLSINWGRPFGGTYCCIYDIVELVVSGFQRKEFIEIISLGRGSAANNLSTYDISALKAVNGFPAMKTYTGRFGPFDESQQTHVFLKIIVDYSNFTLLIPIHSVQNSRPLCDVVISLSLFIDSILWLVASTKILWLVALYIVCLNVFVQQGNLHEIICLTFIIVYKRIRGMEFSQITFIMYYFCGVCENEFPCLWKLSYLSVVVRMSSQNAILVYILEGKDGFEGVERKRLGMVIMRSTKCDQIDGKCGLSKACKPLRKLLFLLAFCTYRRLFCVYLIVAETGDELATKMSMLNGDVGSVGAAFPSFCSLHSLLFSILSSIFQIQLVMVCFVDLLEVINIGVKVVDGKYYGTVENLKWYDERMLQGAENGVVHDDAALGMWLHLRNKDFGVCYLLFGAQLWMMSNVDADYHLLKTSMVLVYLMGFVWDPGKYFIRNCVRGKTESSAAFGKYLDTMPSFISKAVKCGAPSLELRGVLVIAPCVKQSVQWHDCFVHVRSCNPYNIEPAQIFDEAPCQIKTLNSFSSLQMCMAKERNILQAMIEDIWVTVAAMPKFFVFALSHVSYDSYSLWQYRIKMKGQTTTAANGCYIVSFFGISRSMLYALLLVGILAYTNTMKVLPSKMVIGIPVFVFRPP